MMFGIKKYRKPAGSIDMDLRNGFPCTCDLFIVAADALGFMLSFAFVFCVSLLAFVFSVFRLLFGLVCFVAAKARPVFV